MKPTPFGTLKRQLVQSRSLALLAATVWLCCGGNSACSAATPDAAIATPVASSKGKENNLEADRAWKKLQSMSPPGEPKDWAGRQPTDDERRDLFEKQVEYACRASDMARDFYTRFPSHDMAPE